MVEIIRVVDTAGSLGLLTLIVILLARHAPRFIDAMTAIAIALGGLRSDVMHTKSAAENAEGAAEAAKAASELTTQALKEQARAARARPRGPTASDPERAPASRGSQPGLQVE